MPTLSFSERDRVHGSISWWAWSKILRARFARIGCAPPSTNPGSATAYAPRGGQTPSHVCSEEFNLLRKIFANSGVLCEVWYSELAPLATK